MAVDIAQLGLKVRSDGVVVATGHLDKMTGSARRAETASERLSKRAEQMGRTLGRMAALGVTAMAGLAANSIRLAIAAEETASKFQVVFRGSVERSNAELVEMTKTIPLTINQMRGLSSGVQDMLVPMGLVRAEAASLSVQAVQLAGDIASFNDVNADVVLQNIQSALAGSSEPLRKYGVDVREARLQAIALEKGLIGVGDELDSAARAQAVFIAITEDSADAMGDAERTMDSTANQLRFMRRNFVQAQEDLGTLLIPAFNDLLTSLNQVDDDGMSPLMRTMQSLSSFILNTTKAVLLMVAGWRQLKNAIEDVLTLVPEGQGELITGLLTQNFSKIRSGIDTLKSGDLAQHLEDARAQRAQMDAELEASLEKLFATIAGIDSALTELDNGVDRTLDDTRAGMDDLAESAGNAASALAFDSEAFAKLKDQIDPAAKAARELTAARKLLDQAFAQGKIDAGEFERLNILLDLTLDNMTKLAQVDPGVLAELEENFAFLDNLSEIEANLNGLIRTIDPATAALKDMADARVLLNEAFEAGIIDEAEFDRLSDALDKFAKTMGEAGDTFGDTVALVQLTADTLSRSAEDGSDSQKAFALATELANTALAIQAVLNQGSGDPYSAFARMAAMAAIVASLGQSIGSFGRGSFANLSQTRQATQGTGTVLGDTEAKTESILRATEITADATSELVGINRGMLHALQSLQQGIEGAVVQLARGSGQVDFGGLPSTGILDDLLFGTGVFDVLGLNFVGDFLKDLLGGSADLVDEGIEILGGALDEIFIRAFQSVEVKKHIFDDTDLEESFQDLDESVQQQFQLVFDSITDTVRQAAIALGIPLDVIDERIQSFIVESQRISLKDLDADEQREELLAVFGRIFDDLAAHVVPFIDQFQKVGEGLGETLVRVATSVQVFQEAVMQLGFAADLSDPEAVAQMAVGLVELTGGVSEFISQFTTFMDKFASDEQKLAFVTDQLNRAFEQAGLTVPATADGMWALMQSLDATTEEGREQIATLLRLADVAAEYYDLVESAEEERLRQAQVFRDQVQLVTDFIGTGPSSALRDLVNRFEQAMAAARSLGASTREYAMILRAFDRQLQRMAAELTLRIISLTQQLFGSQMQQGMVEPIAAGVEETRLIANSLFTDWQRALSNLREFTQSILLNEALTTLTPAERLAEAQAQFEALLQAAMGGDVEAAEALPGAAQELLEVARFMFASGKQYQDIFNMVLSALEGIDIPANIPEFIEDSFGGGTGLAPPPLTPLDLVAQALERVLLAMDLAEALRDLALVLDTSVIKLAKELGIPLNELVELLGVELGNLTDQTASALASAAELLGADVFELAEAVGISIEELAIASGVHLDDMSQALVTELRNFADQLGVSVLDLADKLGVSVDAMAETFGISIENFEAAHFSALVDFSDAIGLSITEVTETLGISLGDIADATSTLSQALDMAIAELPDAIQADLGPMLDAIRHATTQADANLAIQQIGNYILGLPPDIAASLMPFLELIGFQAQTPELTALQQIEANTRAIVDAIAQIGNINITIPTIPGFSGGGGGAAGGPAPKVVPPSWVVDPSAPGGGYWKSFQEGGWIDQTGLYQLHAGEAVVNPTASNLIVVRSDSDGNVQRLLERLLGEVVDLKVSTNSYQQDDLQNTKAIASGVREQAEQTRRTGTRGGCR